MNKLRIVILTLFLASIFNNWLLGTEKTGVNKPLSINRSNRADSTQVKVLRAHANKKWALDEINIDKDTLKFVSPDDFFYYPFGKYSNIKTFALHSQIWGSPWIKTYNKPDETKVYIFTHLHSSLFVLRNPDTGLIELFNARISDKDVRFVQPIAVGMDELNFLQIFFKGIDQSSIKGVKVVKVESTIEGIWNRYFFTNGRLDRVTFDTDYIIK